MMRQVLVTDAVGKKLPAELDGVSLRKAYARWAPVYDLVFGPVFERGRRAATAAADPIDDPPEVRDRSHGFRVGPGCAMASSAVTVT